MGRLVAVEGLDGAGKHTLTGALAERLRARGARVASVGFPRYADDVHAELARDALHGRLGDVVDSVYAMALLFALDRRAAQPRVAELLAEHDVLLADRYIASNAAYSAARLGQGAGGEFAAWLRGLEVDRFGSRVPDLQVLLDVDAAVAAGRATRREVADGDRARDSYETDGDLQERCAAVYRGLARRSWLAEWETVDGAGSVDTAALADRCLGA